MVKGRMRPLASSLGALVLCAIAAPAAPGLALASGPSASGGYDPQRLLAGHLLRRTGFGPTDREIERVLSKGFEAYVDEQLDPKRIDDRKAIGIYGTAIHQNNAATYEYQWYLRMRYSRRQLLEKTTLFWQTHFSASAFVPLGPFYFHRYEATLRRDAFGNFRDLLADVTREGVMLYWLSNDRNDGNARDEAGERVPPNENYAREFLQLFSMGPARLELDGSPVLDAEGRPVPNYTEDDVKEIARALTGWAAVDPRISPKSKFIPALHDSGPKTIFGQAVAGRAGPDGALEVGDVVELVMRHPSTAPFVARKLVYDFATETPTPGYVRRVATVFRDTGGDLRATLRAVLLDPEFTSPEVVRTQFKTPVEHVLGIYRALDVEGTTPGNYAGDIATFTQLTGMEVDYPASVFSFYPPGAKVALVTTSLAQRRDAASAEVVFNVSGFRRASFDAAGFVARHRVATPAQCVDALAEALLRAELAPAVRAEVLAYMGGELTTTKVRGAAWLVMCSPDFQVN